MIWTREDCGLLHAKIDDRWLTAVDFAMCIGNAEITRQLLQKLKLDEGLDSRMEDFVDSSRRIWLQRCQLVNI